MTRTFTTEGAAMEMDWTYVNYRDGQLFDDDGYLFDARTFANESEAEAYLEATDIRATIR